MSKREPVIPAKTGIQGLKFDSVVVFWIPAFAGMTMIRVSLFKLQDQLDSYQNLIIQDPTPSHNSARKRVEAAKMTPQTRLFVLFAPCTSYQDIQVRHGETNRKLMSF